MEGLVREAPIIFYEGMANRLFSGRMIEVRKALPEHAQGATGFQRLNDVESWSCEGLINNTLECSFGKIGDHLWVRERFRVSEDFNSEEVWYKDDDPMNTDLGWIRPTEMPRTVSRATLRISDIHIERLHDIETNGGAYREGFVDIKRKGKLLVSAFEEFKKYWYNNHKAAKGKYWQRWAMNPWVWVMKFDIIHPKKKIRRKK